MTEDPKLSREQPIHSEVLDPNKIVGSDLQLVLGNIQLLNNLLVELLKQTSYISLMLESLIPRESETDLGTTG